MEERSEQTEPTYDVPRPVTPGENGSFPNAAKNKPSATKQKPSTTFVVGSWVAVALMAGFIFFMSAHTGSQLDHDSGIISLVKAWLVTAAESLFGHPVDVSPVGHFTEFLIFGILLANALRLHVSPGKAAILALVIASGYGITDELHQIFVPSRSCDPADWAVDTIAAAIGAAIVYVRTSGFHSK